MRGWRPRTTLTKHSITVIMFIYGFYHRSESVGGGVKHLVANCRIVAYCLHATRSLRERRKAGASNSRHAVHEQAPIF